MKSMIENYWLLFKHSKKGTMERQWPLVSQLLQTLRYLDKDTISLLRLQSLWKSLEQSCSQAATVLHSTFEQDYLKVSLSCITPAKPSEFSYLTAHSSKEKARSAISQTLLPSRSVIPNHYLHWFLQPNFTIVYGLDDSFIISHHSKVWWHANASCQPIQLERSTTTTTRLDFFFWG